MSKVTYGRGYVYSIKYHIVWCTKYRHKVLIGKIDDKLKEIIKGIANDNDFTIEEMETDLDHIQLLISCSLQHYIPNLIKALKDVSARLLFKEFPELKNKLWGGHLWNPSYFVATVSENTEEQIREYIQSQKQNKKEVNLSMKTVIKGYKYRIYLTEEQKELINKTFGCSRFIYNHFLAMKIELYETEQKTLSYTKCSNLLTELKKEKEWLKEVDKFALQNSLKNLDTAYQNFFREIQKGNTNQGFPKFKSKKNNYKSYRTNFTNNNIEVDFGNNQIKLPKLKWIKCKLHRKFTGKILSATISQAPSGKYFVSLNIECEHEELSENNNSIGLDLGISDLLITSNGETFENKKLTYKYEKTLAKLQRQLAKKQKGSNNFHKQRIKVAKLHEKITNIRMDNLHKISSQIVKENQFIFSEDLNIKGMVKNPNLAKSIHDVSWAELIRQLQYKSEWNNRTYHKVDRFYASSQICNNCNYKNNKTKNLSIREWTCSKCGTYHNRDINASINILNQGLKDLELVV